jgi:hypothetical protein
MRCEVCHGKGYRSFEEYYTCVDCNGSGITSCCDMAGSNVGEVSMKKVGDFVNENVRNSGAYISADDPYIFAHNADAYLIWNKKTGEIVWVGETGKLGEDGYSVAWDQALELNSNSNIRISKHSIICCVQVRDKPPHVPSSIKNCSKCKKPVYLANSTPTVGDPIIMCIPCINWEKDISAEELTEAQALDIADAIINQKFGG